MINGATLSQDDPNASAQRSLKTRPKFPKSFSLIREQQRIAMDDIRNPETTPAARAQLMRAFDVCEERIRVMRMRPAPKPQDVEPRRSRRKSPIVPLSAAPPPPPSSAADSQASA